MKLLAFTLVLLLSGTEAFANMNSDNIRYDVQCVEGVKVMFTYSAYGDTDIVTAIQLLGPNEIAGGPPQPMECDNE